MGAITTFRLTRYFSVLSLVLIAVAGGALGLSARQQATLQMTNMAQDQNEAIGQVFLNQLWPDFSEFVATSTARSGADLSTAIHHLGLPSKAAVLMRKSNIIKVKVYNRDGLTVFSSVPAQIGESKRDNQGFATALSGHAVSALTHRDQFNSFDGALAEVDVVSSYLPIRDGERIAGVIELYQDVTPHVQQLNRVLVQVILVGAAVMILLYLAQLMVVRYAQGTLHSQEAKLREANRELDTRVEERTLELALINSQLETEAQERRQAQAKLAHLAHHDPLTDLPNRLLFAGHLQRSIARAERSRRRLALLFIDLDRFKEVNDTLGHAMGDQLLIEVAHRLSGELRSGDLLARLGGDEFVCVLEGNDMQQEASRVANKLITAIARPLLLHQHEILISASIGISLYPADGMDTDNLLRAADTAMYEAKKHGRNAYHFYAPEMTQHARERAQLERLLRHALENNELEVHYQVQMTLGDPTVPGGVEALARWNNAELGSVPPVKFIPIAEETGMIVALGEWVLRTACRQLAAWRASGVEVPSISVNLSVRQLERSDILQVVRAALEESALAPQSLELEITESVIMKVDDAIGVLQGLHDMGVRLAVDDFGTGYSSLAYLKLMPIDTLKIDRSFVIGIGDQKGDEPIIQTIIGLARNLGLSTVAEGVETMQQLAFLQQAGCDQIQGYYFGRPEPASEFIAHWQRACVG